MYLLCRAISLDGLNPSYTTYFKYLSEGVVFNRVVAREETNHRSLDILCIQIYIAHG